MLTNHFLNPSHTFVWGILLLFVNLVLGFLTTVVVTKVSLKIFGKMTKEDKEDQKILYRVGTVITSQVDSGFGQVEIQTKGAPITINARSPDGTIFLKGQKVLIFDQDAEKGIYYVDSYEND
jgi:hypothetical protein